MNWEPAQVRIGVKTPLKGMKVSLVKGDARKSLEVLTQYIKEELNVMDVVYTTPEEDKSTTVKLVASLKDKKIAKDKKKKDQGDAER